MRNPQRTGTFAQRRTFGSWRTFGQWSNGQWSNDQWSNRLFKSPEPLAGLTATGEREDGLDLLPALPSREMQGKHTLAASLKHHAAVLSHKPLSALLLLCTLVFAASPVSGQEVQEESGFPAERMRSVFDDAGIISLESATTPGHLRLSMGVWGGYLSAPMVVRDENGNRVAPLITDRAGGAFHFSMGLGESFLLGVELPLIFYQARDANIPAATAPLSPLARGGIGDIRVAGKWAPVTQSRGAPLNLAFILGVTAPTSGGEGYRGESWPTAIPEVALSRYFLEKRLRLGANVSATARASKTMLDQNINSEGAYGLGLAWTVAEPEGRPFDLAATLTGSFSLKEPFRHANQTSMEIRGQIGWMVNDQGVSLVLGGGGGILPGWATPDWRVFGGLRWSPPPPSSCPECPDLPDNDGDGVPDAYDMCPSEPGLPHQGGCPEKKDPEPEPEVQEPAVALSTAFIEVLRPVTFAFNSDELASSALPILDEVAELFRSHRDIELVQVEGHTDSLGDPSYNLRLSQRRATSVVRYLVEQGVEVERLIPRGFGASAPIVSNDDQEGRERNRRVVFRILRRDGLEVDESNEPALDQAFNEKSNEEADHENPSSPLSTSPAAEGSETYETPAEEDEGFDFHAAESSTPLADAHDPITEEDEDLAAKPEDEEERSLEEASGQHSVSAANVLQGGESAVEEADPEDDASLDLGPQDEELSTAVGSEEEVSR